MARVDYTGVPQEAPQVGAPEDYERIQASPQAFGAGIAQGLGEVGAGALKAESFYGAVAADNATNNTLQQVTNALYGDPSKTTMGPDGKPTPDTGYFGLRGADAMRARDDISKHIDEIIQENRGNLATPAAQQQYDLDTRRYRAQWQREMGEHADQQQHVWATDTNTTAATLALNAIARNPNNPTPDMIDAVRTPLVRNAQLNGEDAGGAVLKADQAIALMQVQSMAPHDPTAAFNFLKSKSDLLASTPQYDGLYNRLQGASRSIDVNGVADGVLGSHAPGTPIGNAPRAENVAPLFQKAIPGLVVTGMGRTPAQNAAVNGVPDSAHLQDHALDIRPMPGLTVDKLQEQANALGLPNAKVIYEGPGAAHSTAPHFHIQWSGGAGKPQEGAPAAPAISTADYYRTNYTQVLGDADAEAARSHPNDPVFQQEVHARVEQKMNDVIKQQELGYKADADLAYSAANGSLTNGKMPSTMDELRNINPQVGAALDRLAVNNPLGYMNLQTKVLTANSHGAALGYGKDFYKFFLQATAPASDPNRVTDVSKFYGDVDPSAGENSPLTNTGLSALKDIIGQASTPQGAADAIALRNFFNAAHQQINPLQNEALGVYYPKGEDQFRHYVTNALQEIAAQRKANPNAPLADILKDSGPIYTLRFSGHFVMTPTEQMDARLGSRGPGGKFDGVVYDPHLKAARARDTALKNAKTADDLNAAFQAGTISKHDRDERAIALGLARRPPPQTPAAP